MAATLLASCSSEDSPETFDKNEIRFSTGVTLQKSSAYSSSQVAQDQKVGIFINENDANPITTYQQNLSYIADGDGNLSGPVQYFPSNGKSVKISAYHPYYDGVNDDYTFSVEADQTDEGKINSSDLLFCPEFIQQPTALQITLNFKHKLTLIKYILKSGNGNPDLTGAQVSVVNANSAINFNRKTGELGNLSQKREIKLSENGGIIVPQDIDAGTNLLKITLASGKQLYYTTDKALKLESGKKYTFELLVNLSEASSIGTSVDEWQTGETITGEVGENTSDKLLPAQINYNMPKGEAKYVFDYDDSNKLTVLEIYDRTTVKGNEIIDYSIYTFSYDNNGKVSGFVGEMQNRHDPNRSVTVKATITYDNPMQVTLIDETTHNGKTTTESLVYKVDENERYLSMNKSLYTSTPVNEYDAKANLVKRIENYSDGDGNTYNTTITYEYDSKNNFIKNLNIPGWLIHYFAGLTDAKSPNNINKKTSVSYKNGSLWPGSTSLYSWEYTYNSQNYPTQLKYTIKGEEMELVYITTATYKSWK